MEDIHKSNNMSDQQQELLIVNSRRQKIQKDRFYSTKRNDDKIKFDSKTLRQANQNEKQKNKELIKRQNAEIQYKLETKRRDHLKRRDLYCLRKTTEFQQHRNNALRRIRERKVREREEAELESKDRIRAALVSTRAKRTEEI